MIKFVSTVLFTAFLALPGQALAQLKVGVPTNTAGWSFHDKKTDTDKGIVYDLIGAMQLGPTEIVPMPFASLIPSLLERKIDLIAGNLSISPERSQQVAFSTPFFKGADGLVVAKTDLTDYKTWDDLKGWAVGTFAGSIYVKPMTESGLDVKTFASPDEIVSEVNEGHIKAAIGPGVSLGYIVAQGAFPNTRFVRSYQPKLTSQIALAVRKDDGELLSKVNAALARLDGSGELRTIFSRWGQ